MTALKLNTRHQDISKVTPITLLITAEQIEGKQFPFESQQKFMLYMKQLNDMKNVHCVREIQKETY